MRTNFRISTGMDAIGSAIFLLFLYFRLYILSCEDSKKQYNSTSPLFKTFKKQIMSPLPLLSQKEMAEKLKGADSFIEMLVLRYYNLPVAFKYST